MLVLTVCSFEGANLYSSLAQSVEHAAVNRSVVGSSPVWVVSKKRFSFWYFWDLSSAGRASALQAEGHRFEPCRSHLYGEIAQLVRATGS